MASSGARRDLAAHVRMRRSSDCQFPQCLISPGRAEVLYEAHSFKAGLFSFWLSDPLLELLVNGAVVSVSDKFVSRYRHVAVKRTCRDWLLA